VKPLRKGLITIIQNDTEQQGLFAIIEDRKSFCPTTKALLGTSMKSRYVILGAGMQGTATAYDLAKFSDPESIILADASFDQASRSADRVNHLTGSSTCIPKKVDALDPSELSTLLLDANVLLSCVPYWMHPAIADVAIATKTNMLDLGGNTEVTRQTLAKDSQARDAGISLVPDCGLAPGLVNSLGFSLIERLGECESVKLYCGVLPQNPIPPLNYKTTFNVEGLVTEYDYSAVALRNGEIQLVPTLTELETLELEGLGTMEAFVTSGGTSMAPYSVQGKVTNYEYKTIRFPGHCQIMKVMKDFGLWREDEVDVRGTKVKPKDVWCRVFGEELVKIKDKDQCVIRAIGIGMKEGKKVQLQIDIHDRQCDETGFTSMERLTGFSLSTYAIDVANGQMKPGALRYEQAMSGTRFVEQIQRRGIKLKFSEEAF
jgi:lysine 6-dehydrogenase